MVAPKGKTNDDTSSDTPNLSFAFFIVTGRAAALDEVENPNEVFGSYQELTQDKDNRFLHPSKKALV